MTGAKPTLRRAHFLVAFVVGAIALVTAGGVAYAHTDFDSSLPTDGAVVEGPLSEVVVNFTNPATSAGEGFELLDPTGTIRTPSSIDEADGTSFVLAFEPPLEAGTYGLRWNVRAGDAHPIDGSFTFDVTAPPSTTTPLAPGSSATPVAPPGSDPSTTAAGATALDDFLETEAASGGSVAVGRFGRALSMLGMIFGAGVLAALVWTVRGRREELDTQLTWIRLAGLVVFTGGFIEFVALADSDPGASYGALFGTRAGVATALKMAGGLAVLFGFHRRAGRIVAPTPSLSAAVATDLPTDAEAAPGSRQLGHGEHRWTPSTSAALGLAGYALVLVSFWFDGHTATKGPWVVHSIVNFVHLGAAAVWGGGVFAMTTVVWMRRHRPERTGLAAMVVRFSSVASVTLATVIVAGLVMAWMVVDSPSDLFGTEWGRVLMAKTAAVAVAAGMGAYNHFRLRPALEQRPDDPELASELRVSLSIESSLLVTVVALSAVLVASAT